MLNNLNSDSRFWEQVIISVGVKLFISLPHPAFLVCVFTIVSLMPSPRTINPVQSLNEDGEPSQNNKRSVAKTLIGTPPP